LKNAQFVSGLRGYGVGNWSPWEAVGGMRGVPYRECCVRRSSTEGVPIGGGKGAVDAKGVVAEPGLGRDDGEDGLGLVKG